MLTWHPSYPRGGNEGHTYKHHEPPHQHTHAHATQVGIFGLFLLAGGAAPKPALSQLAVCLYSHVRA